MNFVGHAVVAGWRSDAPRYVLGAMLPDFLGMAQARLARVDDGEVARGVEHHHTTDAVFHAAPDFVALQCFAAGELRARGVPRAGARAVAHVGTELLLDGLLVEDPTARALYLDSLRAARPPEDGLCFPDATHRTRWERLHERLESWGPPDGYRDPDFVADRLAGLLAKRPRLALDAAGEHAMRDFLPRLERAVAERAASLLAYLRQHLG